MNTNTMRRACMAAAVLIIGAALPLSQSSGLTAPVVLSASALYGQPDADAG